MTKIEFDPLAPMPTLTNFQHHVLTFEKLRDVTVTTANEDKKLIAMTMPRDDDSLQEQAIELGKDRFYDVSAGYRDDIGAFCVVLEGDDR